jgi:adenylyltransferase/sulfurtransferase
VNDNYRPTWVSEPEDYFERQIAFGGIGSAGQRRLAEWSVLVVGCGGIGTVVAQQLVRAGVGAIRLVDRDFVEWDNLHRQVLFEESDARDSLPKAIAAAQNLRRVNSRATIEPVVTDLGNDNVAALLDGVDVAVDGTDNFDTRYVINEAAVRAAKPWIYCAAVAAHGMTMTVVPGETPCLQCLYRRLPEPGSMDTCAGSGVVNSVTGLLASVATAEVLKLAVGAEPPAPGLLVADVWRGTFQRFGVPRRSDCPVCVHRSFPHLDRRAGAMTETLCAQDTIQIRFRRPRSVDLAEVSERLSALGEVERNEFLVRFRAEGRELVLFDDGRALVRGVTEPTQARAFYATYVGL